MEKKEGGRRQYDNQNNEADRKRKWKRTRERKKNLAR
jgi:hypothetical protein